MCAAVEQAAVANPDVGALRDRALESITLAIELFNRPSECARSHAVIILLHHGFELILKSIIVDKTGGVFDEERGYSYGFDKCLAIAREEGVITVDHRKFLSILDNARDCAVHYYEIISEPVLYILAQASVSLFDELIKVATGSGLLAYLPQRVMPLSAIPPSELCQVLEREFEGLKEILGDPEMTKQQALAVLRPLMAFNVGGEEQHRRMSNAELEEALKCLDTADSWRVVFPEIAKVRFDSAGEGIVFRFKVVKDSADALPIRVVKPGEPVVPEGVIIEREISVTDKFNLSVVQISEKIDLTVPRVLAMLREYEIHGDRECFREIKIGRSIFKRYSKKALDILREKVDCAEACWSKHRGELTQRKRAARTKSEER